MCLILSYKSYFLKDLDWNAQCLVYRCYKSDSLFDLIVANVENMDDLSPTQEIDDFVENLDNQSLILFDWLLQR